MMKYAIPIQGHDVMKFNMCLFMLMVDHPDRFRVSQAFLDRLEVYYRLVEPPSEKVDQFFAKWGRKTA